MPTEIPTLSRRIDEIVKAILSRMRDGLFSIDRRRCGFHIKR